MSAAESVQKDGMDGVHLARRWLESTTWIELPFDVYANAPVCTLTKLDGKRKRFDLFGYIHHDPQDLLYVEVKNYESDGGKQGAEYWEFLANSYSITARDLQDGEDARREFMWVTKHPFQQSSWTELTSPERIKEALKKHPEVLGGKEVDANILATVAERLWLLVFHQRQENLMLTPQELSQIEGLLNRKGKK